MKVGLYFGRISPFQIILLSNVKAIAIVFVDICRSDCSPIVSDT